MSKFSVRSNMADKGAGPDQDSDRQLHPLKDTDKHLKISKDAQKLLKKIRQKGNVKRDDLQKILLLDKESQ